MTPREFIDFIETAPFQYAHTMPQFPQYYTLRKKNDYNKFMDAVKFIRANGEKDHWYGQPRRYLYTDKYRFWDMNDEPIDKTILINRVEVDPINYDLIGSEYDCFFQDEASKVENQMILDIIKPYLNGSVLDIGCGTGLLLDLYNVPNYIGVDPSVKMLSALQKKHPERILFNEDAKDMMGEFDFVVCLFSASYLKFDPRRLCTSEGKYFLMYYKPGYAPVTYRNAGLGNRYYGTTAPEGKKLDFGNYEVLTNIA